MRNKLFALLVIVLLITGGYLLFSHNNTILKMENRQAKTIDDISEDAFMLGTLENDVASVLLDQTPRRDELITLYYQYKMSLNNCFHTEMPKATVEDETEQDTETQVQVGVLSNEVVEFGDGYLTRNIADINWDEEIQRAGSRGYNMQELRQRYPNVLMYIYMPTKIEQTHLIDDEFTENRFDEILAAYKKEMWGGIKFKMMEYESIEEYEKYYYRTDIHWNIEGSYRGYKEIIEMIKEDFDIEGPREVKAKMTWHYDYYGSNARKIGNAVKEPDHITDMDLGIKESDYRFYFDGYYRSLDAIKNRYRKNGMAGNENVDDYVVYFDTFCLKRVFDFNQEDKPNLLIIADSYVNPIMTWLASHFNKTVILDMRFLNEDFSMDEIMKTYEIDAILNLQYYENLWFNGNCFIPLN